MKKLILSIAMMLMVLFSFGQHRHRNMGGHYIGGHGSSHRGGHYVNYRTHNRYTHHRRW